MLKKAGSSSSSKSSNSGSNGHSNQSHQKANEQSSNSTDTSERLHSLYSSVPKKVRSRSSREKEIQSASFATRVSHRSSIPVKKYAGQQENHRTNQPAKFLSTFAHKTTRDAKSSQMIVTLNSESDSIAIFDLSGDATIDAYQPGHKITHFTVSQHSEDVFVSTIGEDRMLRIAKIENILVPSQVAPEPDADGHVSASQKRFKVSTEPSFNLRSYEQLELDSLQDHISTFEYVQFKGSLKYFLIGSVTGDLHIYNRNGTFVAKESLSDSPILSMQRAAPNMLFSTENEIGFFNLNTLTRTPFSCPTEGRKLIETKTDPYSANIVFALTASQELLVFEVKPVEETCRLKQTFSFEREIDSSNSDFDDDTLFDDETSRYESFAVIKNFVVLMSGNQLRVLNSTDLHGEGITDGFNLILDFPENQAANHNQANFYSIAQQRQFQGNLLLLGREDTFVLFEVTTPISKEVDFLAQIRIPLIITVVAGVLGYQFWRSHQQKSKYNNNNNSSGNKFGGNPMQAGQQAKATRGQPPVSKLGDYKNRLNSLEESTSDLGMQMKGILKGAKKQLDQAAAAGIGTGVSNRFNSNIQSKQSNDDDDGDDYYAGGDADEDSSNHYNLPDLD